MANSPEIWDHEKPLVAGLELLGAHLRRIEAPARVERRLLRAFHEEAGGRTASRPGWSWRLAIPSVATIAATASLAVLLFLNHPFRPHGTVAPGRTAVAEVPAGFQLGGDGSGDPAGFIPLPNADDLAPNEEMDLVRVEVPRSTLVALGLPISEDRPGDRVEADVVLGPDGLARAVRLRDE